MHHCVLCYTCSMMDMNYLSALIPPEHLRIVRQERDKIIKNSGKGLTSRSDKSDGPGSPQNKNDLVARVSVGWPSFMILHLLQ
jgi:hypothetical protein